MGKKQWEFNGNAKFFIEDGIVSWQVKSSRKSVPLKQISTVYVDTRRMGIKLAIGIILTVVGLFIVLGSLGFKAGAFPIIIGLLLLAGGVFLIINSKSSFLNIQASGGANTPIAFKKNSIDVAYDIEKTILSCLTDK